VATDRDVSAGGRGPPNNQTEEAVALVSELIEALTAAGNYLTAANYIFGAERWSAHEPLGEALEKSLVQFERANEAVCRLRDFFRRQNATNHDGP
jgi:hypothetical protein